MDWFRPAVGEGTRTALQGTGQAATVIALLSYEKDYHSPQTAPLGGRDYLPHLRRIEQGQGLMNHQRLAPREEGAQAYPQRVGGVGVEIWEWQGSVFVQLSDTSVDTLGGKGSGAHQDGWNGQEA